MFVLLPDLVSFITDVITADTMQWTQRWQHLHLVMCALHEDSSSLHYEHFCLLTQIVPHNIQQAIAIISDACKQLRCEWRNAYDDDAVVNEAYIDIRRVCTAVRKLRHSYSKSKGQLSRVQARNDAIGPTIRRILRMDIRLFHILTTAFTSIPSRVLSTVSIDLHGITVVLPTAALGQFPVGEQFYLRLFGSSGSNGASPVTWMEAALFIACGAYGLLASFDNQQCQGMEIDGL